MKFEQMKENFIKKLGQEGFDKKLTEFSEAAKDYDYKDAELDDYIMRRFIAYLTKAASGGTKLERVETEVIFLTRTKSDFGRAYQHSQAMKKSKENFEKALKMGLINSEGEPLWQGKGDDKGKPIDLENYDINYLGIANIGGDWKRCLLSFNQKMAVSYELYRPIKGIFGMRKHNKMPDNIDVSLGPIPNVQLVVGDKLDTASMKSLITTYYVDYVIDDVKVLEDIDPQDFSDSERAKGYNRFHVIIGDTDDGVESNEKASWIKVNLPLPQEDIDAGNFAAPMVQCWINDPQVEKNIKAGAIDIIIFGRFSMTDQEDFGRQYSMGNVSIYCDDMFILKPEEKADTITPTNGKEEPQKDFSGVDTTADKPDENQFA